MTTTKDGPLRSALILIGGKATRAEGREKFLFAFHGRPFIEHQAAIIRTICQEIVLVARDREQCRTVHQYLPLPCIADIRREKGPMGALHAGVKKVSSEVVFVTACDMPLLSGDIIRYLFEKIGDADAAVPVWEDGTIEPLHAVYRRRTVQDYLDTNDEQRAFKMIRDINSVLVPVGELQKFDPNLYTFLNINDIEALNQFRDYHESDRK